MKEFFQSCSQFFEDWGQQLYDTFIEDERYMWLVRGLGNTLLITIGALLIGVVLGTIIAVTKYFSEDRRALRFLGKLCDIYVTTVRGIPVVVLLIIFYFIVFASYDNGVVVATITFGINSAAYMAELIRGGINSVDPGQMEAGRSLGMTKLQATRKVIFPQAIKNIQPAIGNEMIALLKETAVAGYVAVEDLTRAGNLIRNNTYDAFNPLIAVALVYLVLVIILTKLMGKLERRMRKNDRSKKSA